jgi:hypothetical protein
MKPDQRPSYDKANGICVEIGTWEGGFTQSILEKCSVTKVYCVDPYKHFDNSEYPDAINRLSQSEFDDKFNSVRNTLTSQFNNKVTFIRETSTIASNQFPDESVDFVYIDGNHDYKYVLNDIQAWYPKVKKGGYICGDDIYSIDLSEHDAYGNVVRHWSDVSWGKYGTYKAVVDFGEPFEICGTQFIIKR